MTATSTTVPGSGRSRVSPDSGARRPIWRRRRSTIDSRDSTLKYTENASASRVQRSTPNRNIPSHVTIE